MRPQLSAGGEGEQRVVRLGGPQKIGQTRSERIVDNVAREGRTTPAGRFLEPEQESRRGQHRHHRVGDPGFDGLARLGVDSFRQRRQTVAGPGVDRTTKGPGGEGAQTFTGIGAAIRRLHRGFVGKKALVVPGPRPLFLLQRAVDGDIGDPHVHWIQLLLHRNERLQGEGHPLLTRLPLLIEIESERLVVVPSKFLPEHLTVVEFEHHPATTGIVFETAPDSQLQGHPVAAGVIHIDGGRNRPGFVVGQQDRAPVVGSRLGIGPAKTCAGNRVLGDGPGHRRNGFRHDGLGRRQIFLQQHRRQGEDIADGVEAVAGVVRREFDLRVEVDPHEIADGVAILDPVQPAHGDASGIGVAGIDSEGRILDPTFQLLLVGGGQAGLFLRRHQARAGILQDLEPEVVVEERRVGLQCVEGDFALAGPVAMAVVAVLLEDRLDVAVELGGRGGDCVGPDAGHSCESRTARCNHTGFSGGAHRIKAGPDGNPRRRSDPASRPSGPSGPDTGCRASGCRCRRRYSRGPARS